MAALTQFEADIINDHSAAALDGSNFVVHWGTETHVYNCFAYAVNEVNKKLTPQTMVDLRFDCTWFIYFYFSPLLHAW